MAHQFERAEDGGWQLLTESGEVFVGETMVEALQAAMPDAPPDLIAHLAERDEGLWACEIPTDEPPPNV